jgi:hypothetical protein
MKSILFTGSTCFTGYYFVKKLSEKSKLILTLSKKRSWYLNNYLKRIYIKEFEKNKNISIFYNCKFGNYNFLNTVQNSKIDIICLHHYDVGNLNTKVSIKKKIKEILHNIDFIFNSLIKKKIKIIYTTTMYEKFDLFYNGYNTSRVKYGFSKLLIKLILKNLLKKKHIFKSYLIKNPVGIYQKNVSLFYLLTKKFYLKTKFNCINPNAFFYFKPVELVASNYASFVLSNKSKSIKYEKIKISDLFYLISNKLAGAKKNKFWKNYSGYYAKEFKNI